MHGGKWNMYWGFRGWRGSCPSGELCENVVLVSGLQWGKWCWEDREHQASSEVPVGHEPKFLWDPTFGEDHPCGAGHCTEQVCINVSYRPRVSLSNDRESQRYLFAFVAVPSWRPLGTPKLFTTTTPVALASSSSCTSRKVDTFRGAALSTVSFPCRLNVGFPKACVSVEPYELTAVDQFSSSRMYCESKFLINFYLLLYDSLTSVLQIYLKR